MHQPHPTNQKQQDHCVLTEKRPTWSTLRLCKQCRCTWLWLNYRLPKALWANIYYSQVERGLAKAAILFLNQGLLNYHHVTIDYSISKKSTQWAKQTNDNMTCNFELSPITSAQSNKNNLYKYHEVPLTCSSSFALCCQDTTRHMQPATVVPFHNNLGGIVVGFVHDYLQLTAIGLPGCPRPFEVPKMEKQLPTPRLLSGTKHLFGKMSVYI